MPLVSMSTFPAILSAVRSCSLRNCANATRSKKCFKPSGIAHANRIVDIRRRGRSRIRLPNEWTSTSWSAWTPSRSCSGARCIRTADLTNQMICELGDCDSQLLLLENLNISSNQIHQWSQLVRIIDSLPRLRLLLMNDNLLQPGPERLSYSSPLEVWFGIAYDADSGLVKNFASLQRSSAAISLASPSLDASVGLQRDERASRGRLSRLAPLARPDGELFLRVVGAGGCERVSECHLAVSGRKSDRRRG